MVQDSNRNLSAKMLLRYRFVSAVKVLMLAGTTRPAAISAVAEQSFPADDGTVHRFSRRTIERWCKAFEANGIDGLRDTPRRHCDSSVVLKPDFLADLAGQKEKDPSASIPELLRRARQTGILHPDELVPKQANLPAAAADMPMPTASKRSRCSLELDDTPASPPFVLLVVISISTPSRRHLRLFWD